VKLGRRVQAALRPTSKIALAFSMVSGAELLELPAPGGLFLSCRHLGLG
jgi:hypothetical protein